MKEVFFAYFVPIILLGGAATALALLFWHSIKFFVDEWRLKREIVQIKQDTATLREKRRLDNLERLDTGCEHVVAAEFSGFPPGVCEKCGLAMEKPPGECDHVWRVIEGPVPGSF